MICRATASTSLPSGPGPDGGERLLLRAEHEVEDRTVARLELPRRERPRAVRRVAVEDGAPVDREQHALPDRDVARRRVRQRAVLRGGDDRRERRTRRPAAAHRELDRDREVALRAPDDALGEHLGQRRVGQLRGGADLLDLARVLDEPQLLGDAARGDELDAVAGQLGEPRVLLDRQVVVLEAQARAVGQPADRLLEQVGGDLVLQAVAHLLDGLREVTEVGDEAPDAGARDHGAVRAGEARQPADVDEVGDEQGVDLAVAQRRHQPPQPVVGAHAESAPFSVRSASA
jgi:hypothetical protein